MNVCPKTLLSVAILFVASASIAQERHQPPDPNLMARLSYDNSGVVHTGIARHTCVAVSVNGEYRIVRSLNDGETQRLHGTMPKEEFRQLKTFLGAADFRNLSGDHDRLIRQDSESFAAEIPLAGRRPGDPMGNWLEQQPWRLQWLNADGQNPFPAPVSKLADWLQHFQPADAKSFEQSDYPDVCPTGGLRLLQPALTENSHP